MKTNRRSMVMVLGSAIALAATGNRRVLGQ
jgi:hypothetical protein